MQVFLKIAMWLQRWGRCAGVLRNATRLRAAGALPAPQPAPATASLEERAESLGVVHSHPTWLVRRWLHRWGDAETAELLACNNAFALRPSQSMGIA